MLDDFSVLQKVRIFEDIGREELPVMLSCLGARVQEIPREEFAIAAGSAVEHVGVVLDGRLDIVREDADGGRVLIEVLVPGDYFAESLCCAGVTESPVSVFAESDARVMWLAFRRILNVCPSSCGHHTRLIENMLRALAEKNLLLQNRMNFITKKTSRQRILNYLEHMAPRRGGEFSIPLNREELADFLCIDRSALSRELGRMRQEGILDFRKNSFLLTKKD